MTKVLLASPYTPSLLAWGENMDDLFSARLARGQGAFTPCGLLRYWALHLIAENIDAHSTVLEYAHFDEFEEEVRRGDYDFVGIQLKSIQTEKVAHMVETIRRLSPKSKIVIGGYGILGLDDPVPNDPKGAAEYILSNADYICREEGVRFFRRLIGDDPVERPITQYHMPDGVLTMKGLEDVMRIDTPQFTVSLGCPNGCEFCNTSAFFKRKKIVLADPYEIFAYMKAAALKTYRKGKVLPIFGIYDEDFLLDVDYVRTLGKLIREDDEACAIRFFGFASLKAIGQYDGPEELADLGLGAAWIGIESFEDELISSDHSIEKRGCANIEETIGGLYDHGISNTLSFVLGWDFHDAENIMADVERFIRLKPVMYQIAPLTPCPGTELYRRMQEAKRIGKDYHWTDIHIWDDRQFKLNNFGLGEMRGFFEEAHRRLVAANGPSLLGVTDVAMNFYERYKDSPRHYMARRAEESGEMARNMYAMLPAFVSLAPGEGARERAIKVLERYKRLFGEPSFAKKLSAAVFERIMAREQRLIDEGKREVVADRPWVRTVHEPGREPVETEGPPRPHQVEERRIVGELERDERERWRARPSTFFERQEALPAAVSFQPEGSSIIV